MSAIQSISLGFDFYGSGNLGDDLMLAGFFDAVSSLGHSPNLYGMSRADLTSQRIRFPKVSWSRSKIEKRGWLRRFFPHSASHEASSELTWPKDLWAGVGDTPFQLTCGEWFLDYLKTKLQHIKTCKRRVMVNVGAETEIERRKEDFARIATVFDAISVRDEHSYNILVHTLNVPSERVICSADLAHITMAKAGALSARKSWRLGLIVAGDTLSQSDLGQIGDFITEQPEPVSFIAQELRDVWPQERAIFAKLAAASSNFRDKAALRVPDYYSSSISEMVRPIMECETLMSSRYHGLLIGAWSGCKVAAIGRSSKVAALARELRVPCCVPPLTIEKLRQIQHEAVAVDPARLAHLSNVALEGVAFALTGERPSTPPASAITQSRPLELRTNL